MKITSFFRFIIFPVFLGLALTAIIGCGSTPAAAPDAPAITISSFDLAKAFEADAAKATADYSGKKLKVTDLLAGTHWELDTENYLSCEAYNATTNVGAVNSQSYHKDKKINSVAFPFQLQFNIVDAKILEPLVLNKVETVDGQTKSIFTDLVEVECEISSFTGDALSFKNLKINKK